MITFNWVEWSNFLSNGATPTRINITDHDKTLIRGHNGAGKTTFMDALLYCLFNKPLRKVNLPQLVNSVNKKKMVTVVNFTTRGTTYEIHRGQKPKVFKLMMEVNGVMVEQNSTNDLQKTIESEILRTNYKTFTQVVVMASMNYTNFMSLNPADRRIVVNQMLDLETLTIMTKLLAERAKEVKGRSITVEGTHTNLITRIDGQKRLIAAASESSGEHIKTLDNQIADCNSQAGECNKQLVELKSKYDAHNATKPDANIDAINAKIRGLNEEISTYRSKSISANTTKSADFKTAQFYASNDNCDRCNQVIDATFKNGILTDLKSKCDTNTKIIEETNAKCEELSAKVQESQKIINDFSVWNNECTRLMNDARNIQNTVAQHNSRKNRLQQEKQTLLDKDNGKVDDLQKELDAMNGEMSDLIDKRAEIAEDMELCGLCSQMLSDNGLKAKIIKDYLPIFNNTINHYLNTMGAQYSFMLDEQFNETILSRYRDNFSYGSFSNGEASRINLSILFTFRKIASLKNTVSTNLLIIDEVLDTSLDKDGIEDLMKIITTLEHTNIFVVSHREEIVDLFDNVVTVNKRGNFATYDGI